MTTSPVVTRRRPLPARKLNDIYPDLPEPIPSSPSLPLITPHKVSIAQGRSLQNLLEDTPSPLRELEKGWKELRRRRLSEDRSIGEKLVGRLENGIEKDVQHTPRRKSNVRFTTSASSALLTPPNTPPQSPKLPQRTRQPEVIDSRPPRVFGITTNSLHATHDQQTNAPFSSETSPKAFRRTASIIKPITSHPLPPTLRPIPLIVGQKDTIYIPPPYPTPRYELILNLVGGRRIKVMREGEVVEYIPGKGEEKDTRILNMVEVDRWSKGDKRDWEVVSSVIEGFKRISPRIRIYHPLGQLCITCSTPPDIILHFRLLQSSDNSSITSKQINNDLYVRDERRHDQNKIRITYSRSTSELRTDTHSTYPGGASGKKEIFRTKRSVPVGSCNVIQYDESNSRGISIEDISEYLGVRSNTIPWSEEEKEGLRRLWDLRDEWGRWDDS